MAEKRKYSFARIKETKVEYEGYYFHLNKSYADTKYYDCSFRKNKDVRCLARLKIVNGKYILSERHNGHEKPIKLTEIKKEIKTSQLFESTREIKNRIISKHDHLLDFTNVANVEKAIERYGKKNIGQIAKNLDELRFCLENENWKQFLQINEADSLIVEYVIKHDATKAIIFIDKALSNSITNHMKEKLIIFVDGTFAAVPQLQNTNCQLWTIVIRHDNRTFPIVYAIMEGRTAQNYIDVLRKVTDVLKLTPDTAIYNFEKEERKALHTVFPSATIIGCFFHYSQALVHNASKHGILKGDDKEMSWGATKLLISLAYLPHTLIEEGFQLISTIIFNDCTYLQSFFNYYEETWINGFKPDSFSVFNKYTELIMSPKDITENFGQT